LKHAETADAEIVWFGHSNLTGKTLLEMYKVLSLTGVPNYVQPTAKREVSNQGSLGFFGLD
jgi:hypothetical protein